MKIIRKLYNDNLKNRYANIDIINEPKSEDNSPIIDIPPFSPLSTSFRLIILYVFLDKIPISPANVSASAAATETENIVSFVIILIGNNTTIAGTRPLDITLLYDLISSLFLYSFLNFENIYETNTKIINKIKKYILLKMYISKPIIKDNNEALKSKIFNNMLKINTINKKIKIKIKYKLFIKC